MAWMLVVIGVAGLFTTFYVIDKINDAAWYWAPVAITMLLASVLFLAVGLLAAGKGFLGGTDTANWSPSPVIIPRPLFVPPMMPMRIR